MRFLTDEDKNAHSLTPCEGIANSATLYLFNNVEKYISKFVVILQQISKESCKESVAQVVRNSENKMFSKQFLLFLHKS